MNFSEVDGHPRQANDEEVDVVDFERRIREVLHELNGKRDQLGECQRELSGVLLRQHELERQLETERRTAKGMQMQLELTVKASYQGKAEREALAQKAARNEVQLSLANHEISILRQECNKLETRVVKFNESLFVQADQVRSLNAVKESCTTLQNRMKITMGHVNKELEQLQSELKKLAISSHNACAVSQDFETAFKHFSMLENRHFNEKELLTKELAETKANLDKTNEKEKEVVKSSDSYITKTFDEYRNSLSRMEKSLSEEQESSKVLSDALSKAMYTQETLQQWVEVGNSKIKELEEQILAKHNIELSLYEQLKFAQEELLNAKRKSANIKDAETQTLTQALPPAATPSPSSARVEHFKKNLVALSHEVDVLLCQNKTDTISKQTEDFAKKNLFV